MKMSILDFIVLFTLW